LKCFTGPRRSVKEQEGGVANLGREPVAQAINHAGICLEKVSPVPAAAGSRLPGIDRMRGLVILLMALDHVRDFFNFDALHFDPADLDKGSGYLPP
jgi:hypothetical protein